MLHDAARVSYSPMREAFVLTRNVGLYVSGSGPTARSTPSLQELGLGRAQHRQEFVGNPELLFGVFLEPGT